MKRVLLFFSLFGFFLTATPQYNCWIQFANKKGTVGSLINPSAYLSSKSIARRTKQHLEIDSTDLPVSAVYTQAVLQTGAVLKSSSKWLNGITVILPDTTQLAIYRAMPFVRKVELTLTPSGYKALAPAKIAKMPSMITEVYGIADRQIDMHNGRKLHAEGFRGKGMVIGVLDAGFYRTDQISAFDSLRLQGRLLGTKDFANPSVPFFANIESHGTSVLSTMAANLPDQMIGTAPEASYWLIHTEYSPTEYLVEPDNWVAGLEFADSVGVDVVNSSLGYTEFDNSAMNYTYQSLNGRTSRASIAATMAARKGMIVVNSAGNEGDKTWHYISAPADADSILTVGAVNYNGAHVSFSGYGPTADGRIKPDVCAVGYQTVIASPDNTIITGNGTSFSSPVMAGLVACVWQAFPTFNNVQIINLFKQFSSQYNAPDNTLGYGIPDVYALYKANYVSLNEQTINIGKGSVYLDDTMLKIESLQKVKMPANVVLYTQTGQKLAEWKVQEIPASISLGVIPTGFYLLTVTDSQCREVYKLIKH